MSLTQFLVEEQGQDLIEYALLAAFISLAVVTSAEAVGRSLGTTFQSYADEVGTFGTSS
jgi:Flp pilus assembly pilin Flp